MFNKIISYFFDCKIIEKKEKSIPKEFTFESKNKVEERPLKKYFSGLKGLKNSVTFFERVQKEYRQSSDFCRKQSRL